MPYKEKYKHTHSKRFVLLAGIGLCIIGVLFVIERQFDFFNVSYIEGQKDLQTLWNGTEYNAIIKRTDTILNTTPMDSNALVYSGLAFFYRGIEDPDIEARKTDIDSAIRRLRQALLLKTIPLMPEILYVLAKSYYHKEQFYYDLTIEYMEASIAENYIADDSYEYLGLAYVQLGDYERGIVALEESLSRNQSNALALVLAQIYLDIDDYSRATEHINLAISTSQDDFLVHQAKIMQGKVFIARRQYDQAHALLATLAAEGSNSAEIQYQLGRLYHLRGDSEQARYQWREALRIDSNHIGALRSLQE